MAIAEVLEEELIEISREVGSSKMYQINKDNEAAKALAQFDLVRAMGK